jgi:sterol desaturase/sphingolipid hydroxylase (fatty acid hydroxylase superfamily)
MRALYDQLVLLLSTPLYILVIGAELLISHLEGVKAYSWKDTIQNFALSLLTGLSDLLMRGISLIVLTFLFQYSLLNWSYSVAYWVILLLFTDMMHYWLHRLGHQCRFFWAVHVNHHTSTHFNFSVGFRSGVLEPFYSFIFFIPIVLAGFRPIDIFFMYSVCQVWAILTHTEKVKKLGWLEYIFVTPSHHRVHHASNPKYLDRNMGTVFIMWDKLFGTFQQELPQREYEPIRYGITQPLQNNSIPTLIFHEWAAIMKDMRRKDAGFKQKLMYLFGPPGWSHDGQTMTSDQMRRQEHIKNSKVPPMKKGNLYFMDQSTKAKVNNN